jgi:hypothetical protein
VNSRPAAFRTALRRTAAVIICAAVACAAAAAGTPQPAPGTTRFTFAALGDTPYVTDEEPQFVAMMGEMNREPLAFAVHVGDFKSSWTGCTDALFLQRREWFDLAHHPFIYVPGDNEWSDCWRPLGEAREPLERLERLRAIFFADGYSLGQPRLKLDRQSAQPESRHAYPEHVRWVHGRVMFVTLNMPGGDNNRARMPKESAARTAAARDWLASSFAIAKRDRLGAVVVAMQANPWTYRGTPRPSYASLLSALAGEMRAFGRTVALIHGDTHRFRVDRPLVPDPETRQLIPGPLRIEVFGYPGVEWVRVAVKEDAAGTIRFEVTRGSEKP